MNISNKTGDGKVWNTLSNCSAKSVFQIIYFFFKFSITDNAFFFSCLLSFLQALSNESKQWILFKLVTYKEWHVKIGLL